ncbi:MAG: hypothetical protein RL216_439 [Pseudomonadota bacterium]|jgi:hypothetical protein
MHYGLALLRKLGLFAHKQAQIDPKFDLRLQKIGAREQLRPAQTTPIRGDVRNQPARRAV